MEIKNKNFGRKFCKETVIGISSHELALKLVWFWHVEGPTCHVSASRAAGSIFVLLDSDSGKLYAIPKCFRDTDATAKSVSSNSSSKNLDMPNLADSGKPKIPKIIQLKFSHFLILI